MRSASLWWRCVLGCAGEGSQLQGARVPHLVPDGPRWLRRSIRTTVILVPVLRIVPVPQRLVARAPSLDVKARGAATVAAAPGPYCQAELCA